MKSKYPHIEWLDLQNNGIMYECGIMKKDGNGNVYFFPLNALDDVDKTRLRNILKHRNAAQFPLWDLMQQVTLGNGVNALTYFHQLVQVRSASGQIFLPESGKMGAGMQSVRKAPEKAPVAATTTTATTSDAAAQAKSARMKALNAKKRAEKAAAAASDSK